MKTMLLILAGGMLVMLPPAYSQNAVEYSGAAGTSPSTYSTIGATGNAVSKKGAALAGSLSAGSQASDSARIPKSKMQTAPKSSGPPAPPAPPAVFILTSGERLESSHYVLTSASLQVQSGERTRTIPLSSINVDATVAANHQRGLDLKIPRNTSEVMLSF